MKKQDVSPPLGTLRMHASRGKEDNPLMLPSFVRTLRLRVKTEAYPWLNAAAMECNTVWNFANETAEKAINRTDKLRKWVSGFDLCNLTSGSTEHFERIGADTIQRVCTEYAAKRNAVKRRRLRWRVSRGARRSLGWVPFKSASLKRKGHGLRFCGKTFRVFDRKYLGDHQFKDGCFAQDAVGDWFLCVPVSMSAEPSVTKTRMAKSVLDSGWGILKNQLAYKSEHAGRRFEVVDEKYTSITCSACGSLSGPRGVNGLIVRSWICDCGESHERDVNSARNILLRGEVSPSVRRNESSLHALASIRASRPRETGKRALEVAV